jgi:hypothetical protein
MQKRSFSGSALISALAIIYSCQGEPASATPARDAPPCQQSSKSWVTTGVYESRRYGNYFISNDNWGGTPGQKIWANSERCFGVTTTATVDRQTVGSYPHIVRGWMQSESDMRGTSWTTSSGMGIAVTKLKKAKVHWAFTMAPTPGARWMALLDVYLHKSAAPSAGEFPPFVDLMIDQALADQVVNTTTYYALVAGQSHATIVTFGANKYLVYIDNPGEATYHQPGGHTIHLFQLPTAVTDAVGATWGATDAVTSIDAIVKYFMQASPVDDAGHPLQDASGAKISAPLMTPDLFLNAINAGWEIDVGTAFQTTQFWIAMQDEQDGD